MSKSKKRIAVGFILDRGPMERIVMEKKSYLKVVSYLEKSYKGQDVKVIYIVDE